jgi:O-antigen/teichoic acid export membrane protein
MINKSIFTSIFSNWTFLVLTVAIAFIVSPIMVNKLGVNTYGIWVLMVSISGYFTVLDFGINTALVRFISKYVALKDFTKANEVYSSALALFSIAGAIAIISIVIFSLNFSELFNIKEFNNRYLSIVFIVIGIDLAINLVFGVFSGVLRGLQKFHELNVISIVISLLKNMALVYLLYNDYSILSIAILQIFMSLLKYYLMYLLINKKHTFIQFEKSLVTKVTFKKLYDYSIYSFLIAVAMKIIFYTDSLIIGLLINIGAVTYYSIPVMIVENLEKFIWAAIAVLIPVISSHEALMNTESNKTLYVTGSKYIFMLTGPVLIVLLIAGDEFIGLWMGAEYIKDSGQVLKILLVGYIFSLTQLMAHGILKGISKHKILAYILCFQVSLNLAVSIILAPIYGINGVAIGTTIPILISNIILIPYFTCKELGISFMDYTLTSIIKPIFIPVIMYFALYHMELEILNYSQLILFSASVFVLLNIFSFCFILENSHRKLVINKVCGLKNHKNN